MRTAIALVVVFLPAAALANADPYRARFCEVAINVADDVQSARQKAEELTGDGLAAEYIVRSLRSVDYWQREAADAESRFWRDSRPLSVAEIDTLLGIVFSFPIGETVTEQQLIRAESSAKVYDACMSGL